MPAVPMPDADTEKVLSDARSQAAAALKGRFPDSMLAPPPPAQPGVQKNVTNVVGQQAQPAPPAAPPPPEPGPNAQPVVDTSAPIPPEPGPNAVPVSAPGFLSDEFKGIGRVVYNHVMAGFTQLGRALARSGEGTAMAEDPAHADAAMQGANEFVKNNVDTAYQHWIGQANDQAAGGGAQVLGSVAESLPSMITGPLGMPLIAGNERNEELQRQGVDPKTAAETALATAFATAAGLKISLAVPGLTQWVRSSLQHIASGIVGNTTVNQIQDRVEKYILGSAGYKDAAAQLDPNDPSTIAKSGIMGAIFGAIGAWGHGGKKTAAKPGAPEPTPGTGETPPPPAPGPNATPVTAAPPEPAPPAPGPNATPVTAAPPEPGPASQPVTAGVGDHPSPEPLNDLRAQKADAQDPATPRKGVYLSKDNLAAITPADLADLKRDMVSLPNFDQKGGLLLVARAGDAVKARALRRANGADMQATLGELTGAGEGKRPDQTAVVQGQDAQGNVAKEQMVTPAEVPAAIAATAAEDKTPVVTTPEAAQARRAAGVENQETPPAAEQVSPPASKEAVVPATAEPSGPADGSRHILKIAGEDVPVIVSGKTEGNKVPVRTIDDDGVISKDVRQVPVDMFPKNTEAANDGPPTLASYIENATKPDVKRTRRNPTSQEVGLGAEVVQFPGKTGAEPVPPNAAAREGEAARRDAEAAQHPLEQAASLYDKESTPPQGKKFASSVADHAAQVATLARAVKSSLKDFPDAAPEVIDHANAAADRVLRIDEKTPEAMAHNRGVGHKMLDARAADLKQAVHNLTHPDDVTIPKPVETKATALKVKTEAKAAQAAKIAAAIEHNRQAGLSPAERIEKQTVADRLKAKQAEKGSTLSSSPSVMGEDYDRAVRAAEEETRGPAAPESPAQRRARLQIEREDAAARTEPKTVEVKLKAKQAEKVSSGIRDIEDVTKPKQLNAGDKDRIGAALGRYMRIDPDHAQDAHDNLERVLHEVYGPERPKEIGDLLQLARDQREDDRESHEAARRGGTGRMSDTVDENDLRGHHEDVPEEDEVQESRTDDNRRLIANSPIGKLHEALAGTGLWARLAAARDSGEFVGTHSVLDHLISVAGKTENTHMLALLTKLRQHVPDLPLRPVTSIVHPHTGAAYPSASGLFHAGSNSIQLKLPRIPRDLDIANHGATHAMIHEMVHGATSYELKTNPNGVFATEVKKLLQEARARATRMPEEVGQNHYGLTDEHEFLAEALTNPVFQKFLAESERVAAPKSPTFLGQVGGAFRSLYDRLATATAKLLGIKDPLSAKLLRDTMHVAQRTMEEQSSMGGVRPSGTRVSYTEFLDVMRPDARERLAGQDAHMPGLDDMLDKVHALEDPPPLQHEDRFRRTVGDYTTSIARGFRTAARSGLVESLRRTTRALTPYDGLIRSQLRRGTFGHNEPGNPLRDHDQALQDRNAAIYKISNRAEPIVAERAKLSSLDDKRLGQFQIDATTMGIDADPQSPLTVPKTVSSDPKYAQKLADMQARWKNLSPDQQKVYRMERDHNEWAARQARKASVDLATDAFTEQQLSKAQRSLLYSAKDPGDFAELIGPGKMIDVGDRNDSLKEALRDISSTNELEGPYFHKGRTGEYVVQIRPEVDRSFGTSAEAEAHAQQIRDLSPGSKAKVAQVGDKWQVTGRAEYTSMHERITDAQAEVTRLQKLGFDVGSPTQKILSAQNADLSKGFQSIYAEASRRLDRRAGVNEEGDKAIEDVKQSLRQAFLNQMAARSAYAGSKLARRNVGGVKAEEMGLNFATHAQSQAWNVGHMSTVLKTGDALGRLREATKDDTQPVGTALQRGRVYDEVQRRLRQEVAQYGAHQPFNAAMAKLGFMKYMTSTSHALLYLTQNFTTAIPTAAARFGFGKAASSFGSAMRLVSSPAFRETYRALTLQSGHDVKSIEHAILGAVAKDPRFGKWAKGGETSPLQQLIDRGTIHTSLSNQLALAAQGGNRFTNSVMEYARITAAMADMFNRVSTGLAALELHKGDVYKAGDFVKETHVDYSQDNKPRAFKAVGKLWGGNSVTMFRSYITGMTHLLYSHIYDAAMGGTEGGRGQALKTVAGLMLGTTLFAGVEKGFGIEPVRIAMDIYHHLAGDNNQYYSFDNSVRRAVHSMVGDGKLADVINGGLPRLMGVDLSNRMGLSDLFFHDPPDVLSLKPKILLDMVAKLTGPGMQGASEFYDDFNQALETGRLQDWMKLVPVKAFQNVFDAYKAGTTGKVTATGAQLTQPSAGAAAIHLVGFRTALEAKLAEKAQTEGDYKQWANNRKYMYLQQYTSATTLDEKQVIITKMDAFSQANPGHAITGKDIKAAEKGIAIKEYEAAGGLTRDPVVNELRSH